MILGLHMISFHPQANLNRDSNGVAKSVWINGERRYRFSSQSWKSVIRESPILREAIGKEIDDVRTRQVDELIAKDIANRYPDFEENRRLAIGVLASRLWKTTKDKKKGGADNGSSESEVDDSDNAVLPFTWQEVSIISDTLIEATRDKTASEIGKIPTKDICKMVGEALKNKGGTLPRLFGRMDAFSNLQEYTSPLCIMGGIGTHHGRGQSDFFTAMDDLQDRGAAHMNSTGFYSSVFYQFGSIHWEGLLDNLRGLYREILVSNGGLESYAKKCVSAMLTALIYEHPKGYQNRFGSIVVPDLVILEMHPNNCHEHYYSAFSEISENYGDKLKTSIEKLITHRDEKIEAFSRMRPSFAGGVCSDHRFRENLDNAQNLHVYPNVEEMVAEIVGRLHG